ncbi:MAG: tolB protein precursor, partial [Sphingobacteriales bacterium]
FQGLSEGQGDLYSYNFDTKKVTQLTNDKFSDFQPSYSPDGKKIIFSSDRTTYDRSLSQDITFNLAELDIASGVVKDITAFNGSNNLNPVYSGDGRHVYFLSNYEGFRNLFRYELETGKTEKMTDYFTGISGITEFSPALSISRNDDIVYSYYRKQKYTLFNAKATEFKPVVVAPGASPDFAAGMLPPAKAVGVDLINSNLNNFLAYPRIPTDSIRQVAYKPMFQLDYLASSGIGVGVNSYYGAGLASGIQGAFSDILGQQKIYAGAAVNGQIYDFGAQVAYINQKSRWDKGISLSHIPFQFGFYDRSTGTQNIGGTDYATLNEDSYIVRNFEDAASLFTSYPISRINRLQFAFGASYNSYRIDRYRNTYIVDPDRGLTYYDSDRRKISNEEARTAFQGFNFNSYSLLRGSAAFIGDNSFFGIAAPLNGFRYHFEAEYVFGTFKFFAPTIDFRKYWRIAPVTLAARVYGLGRFGDTGNLYPMFLG